MNRRLVSVFTFALVVAGATSFLVYRLIVSHIQLPGRPVLTNRLLVAAHDLQVGALIREMDLAETSWSGAIPGGAIRERQEIVGRGVIATIYKGEPIVDQRMAPKGAGAGLAATIPVGMRAVALRVNDVVGLAGFVLPGMRVDVLVAGSAPGIDTSRTGMLCRTVLQSIEVLSAGQRIEKNADGKPESAQVVNLLVTPNQAETLNLASSETKVQLVLRNPLDTNEAVTQGATVAGLFGGAATRPVMAMNSPPRLAPVAPPHISHTLDETTIEVFSGTKRSEAKIEAPNGTNR
jgi:pilus assembly protein CpaB